MHFASGAALPGQNSLPVQKFPGAQSTTANSPSASAMPVISTRSATPGAASINQTDQHGQTALHRARGAAEIRQLVVSGAQVDAVDLEGKTPLVHMAWSDHADADCVAALIAGGANVNHADRRGSTALMGAICRGYLDVVDLLIRSGTDITLVSDSGDTAFMIAASRIAPSGKKIAAALPAIIRLLIAAGASVEERSPNGYTALFCAVMHINPPGVEALLDAGADFRGKSPNGDSIFEVLDSTRDHMPTCIMDPELNRIEQLLRRAWSASS